MVLWGRNFLLSKKTNACNENYMDADLNKREPLRRTLRRRGTILVAASILVLAAGIGIHLYLSAQPVSRQLARSTPKPPLRLSMKGGTHTVSADGRKQLRMQFDAIRMHKGKLGFLKFGLFKEAVVENARIEIYRYASDRNQSTSAPADRSANKMTNPQDNARQAGWPQDLMSKQMLASLALEDVRALSFKPAEVQLIDDDRLSWRINAKQAVARQRPARLEFSRQVEFWRPTGMIRTGRLTLNLETGALDWPEKPKTPG
jgi:hypothetical protein